MPDVHLHMQWCSTGKKPHNQETWCFNAAAGTSTCLPLWRERLPRNVSKSLLRGKKSNKSLPSWMSPNLSRVINTLSLASKAVCYTNMSFAQKAQVTKEQKKSLENCLVTLGRHSGNLFLTHIKVSNFHRIREYNIEIK